ncbi:hypothetical protein CP556_08720 [Natrinema sp. CBA1119]|uniref:hypothetical protein n=1 Tax=Natrinema sp. CBA1119 TaxID=1608465 RepID=UPI000BF3FD33|nr:hypothetical protein [Natrinema sp. CBA1119]PGF16187.1 hypothetical protein CP556_08720 [Natrinema sp. CBA1119]
MTLRSTAYLEIDINGGDTTGVFELREDLSDTGDVTKNYLLSNRGQRFREAFDIGTDLLPDDVANADLENRKGYHVDGGSGHYQETLSFAASPGDEWGDGSTDPDNPDDVNKTDATGSDPIAMKQVLEWFVTQSKSDSSGGTRLHIGEWTDGSHSSGAGAFGQPMPVAINESSITYDPDNPNAIEGSITLTWTSLFPDVDLQGAVQDGLNDIADFVQDF